MGDAALAGPRARSPAIAPSHLFRIALMGALLAMIVAYGDRFAEGVSEFVMSFEAPRESGGTGEGGAGAIDRSELRRLSDDEIREEFPSLTSPDGGAGPEPGAAGDAEGGAEPEPDAARDAQTEPQRAPDE